MASAVEEAGGKGGLDSFQLPPGLQGVSGSAILGTPRNIWVCLLRDSKEDLSLSSWGLQGVSGGL